MRAFKVAHLPVLGKRNLEGAPWYFELTANSGPTLIEWEVRVAASVNICAFSKTSGGLWSKASALATVDDFEDWSGSKYVLL